MRNLLLVLRLHRGLRLEHRPHHGRSRQLMRNLLFISRLYRDRKPTHRVHLTRSQELMSSRQPMRNLLLMPRQRPGLSPRLVPRVRRVLPRKKAVREKGEQQNDPCKMVQAGFRARTIFLLLGAHKVYWSDPAGRRLNVAITASSRDGSE